MRSFKLCRYSPSLSSDLLDATPLPGIFAFEFAKCKVKKKMEYKMTADRHLSNHFYSSQIIVLT